MKKIISVLLLIFFFSFLSATPSIVEQENSVLVSEPIRQDGSPSASLKANITIKDPAGNILVKYEEMNNNLTINEHQYFLGGGNTSELGSYLYTITATNGTDTESKVFSFEVTPTGDKLSTSQAMIYLIVLIISIGLFFFSLYWAVVIPWRNTYNSDGTILDKNDLKYVKLFLWFFIYMLSVFMAFLIEHLSGSYLRLGIANNFFNGIFWFLVAGIFPVFVVTLYMGIVAWFRDAELFREALRGLEPR